MSKIYKGFQISKYSPPESGSEPGDIGYVPRNEREEKITRIAFNLDDVITWADCTEEFYTYFDKRPKLILEMKGAGDVIIIEDFNRFTALKEEFMENPFITVGKQ